MKVKWTTAVDVLLSPAGRADGGGGGGGGTVPAARRPRGRRWMVNDLCMLPPSASSGHILRRELSSITLAPAKHLLRRGRLNA